MFASPLATVAKRNLTHHSQWFTAQRVCYVVCEPLLVCEPDAGSIPGHKKNTPFGVFCFGGLGRNRTGIEGFAVLCITTLPPGLNQRTYITQKIFVIQQKNVYHIK